MHGEGRPSKCVYKALRRQKWQKSRAGNSGDRPPERVGEKVLKRKFCRLGRLEKEMQRVQGFRKTDEMAGNEK
jgi:hypothetical protein